MAALNYARMPGFGDLSGDSSHPNSPDYTPPAFGYDDASGNVARHLWDEEEVGEIVDDLAEAASALRRVASGKPLDAFYKGALNSILKHAERMERLRDDEFEKLNGSAA